MEANGDSARKGKKSDWWRPVVFILVIASLLILYQVFGLGQYLGSLRDWIKGLGTWGPIVFVFLYGGAVVVAVPGEALSIAAGMLFGSFVGVICVSIAATLGASLSFLVARYFARDAIARWLSRNEKFRRLDKLTEERGAVIVAFTRLVPLFPYNLLNYGFGLTCVNFWTYVFWSWLCMLPGTVLYVVGSDALFEAISQEKVPWILIGLLAGVSVLLATLIWSLRRNLRNHNRPSARKSK